MTGDHISTSESFVSPPLTLGEAPGVGANPVSPASPPPRLPTSPTAAFIVPCLNEEANVADLVAELQRVAGLPDLPVSITGIYIVDNGSIDATAARATAAGASVVSAPERGYGRACLAGAHAASTVDLLIYLDGDRSDRPDDLPLLLAPILTGEAELVIGSRIRGAFEPGSLTTPQRVGNWLATRLLRFLYGVRLTDVGPFRVIRRDALLSLGMREPTYGWPVEMIARSARRGLRIAEVPVTWRRRGGGVSKVSGDLRASIRAGFRILSTIVRSRLAPLPPKDH
jgi:glycosyltransferase involved in cell wall biosynthesis